MHNTYSDYEMPDWKMADASDDPPTEDRGGTKTSEELQQICEILMNRTECREIRVFDADRGKIEYTSKRTYIGHNVLNRIYRDYDATALYCEGDVAEFVHLGTDRPDD